MAATNSKVYSYKDWDYLINISSVFAFLIQYFLCVPLECQHTFHQLYKVSDQIASRLSNLLFYQVVIHLFLLHTLLHSWLLASIRPVFTVQTAVASWKLAPFNFKSCLPDWLLPPLSLPQKLWRDLICHYDCWGLWGWCGSVSHRLVSTSFVIEWNKVVNLFPPSECSWIKWKKKIIIIFTDNSSWKLLFGFDAVMWIVF